jgi:PII-like signaling protein
MDMMEGERDLLRIFIGERDKYHGKPLYHGIVELLRANHFAGATVLRGIMGFGASAKLHTDRFEVLSLDMPIVVECVESAAKIDAVLPELERMVGGGLITRERVRVLLHRPAEPTGL